MITRGSTHYLSWRLPRLLIQSSSVRHRPMETADCTGHYRPSRMAPLQDGHNSCHELGIIIQRSLIESGLATHLKVKAALSSQQ